MNNIMKLADVYAQTHPVFLRDGTVRSEARAALEAAVKQQAEEIAALQAKLSAMEAVEPVGEVSGNDWSSAILYRDLEPGSPVYAAPKAAQPLSELQINGMCADANRSHDIDLIDYTKAVRDAERAQNIGGQQP